MLSKTILVPGANHAQVNTNNWYKQTNKQFKQNKTKNIGSDAFKNNYFAWSQPRSGEYIQFQFLWWPWDQKRLKHGVLMTNPHNKSSYPILMINPHIQSLSQSSGVFRINPRRCDWQRHWSRADRIRSPPGVITTVMIVFLEIFWKRKGKKAVSAFV